MTLKDAIDSRRGIFLPDLVDFPTLIRWAVVNNQLGDVEEDEAPYFFRKLLLDAGAVALGIFKVNGEWKSYYALRNGDYWKAQDLEEIQTWLNTRVVCDHDKN